MKTFPWPKTSGKSHGIGILSEMATILASLQISPDSTQILHDAARLSFD